MSGRERRPTQAASRRAAATEASRVRETPSGKRRTNLTLDHDAVAAGERYGLRHGTNLSQLVNGFLHGLEANAGDASDLAAELTPAVRRLYGAAAGGAADRNAHRAHLIDKYGRIG